MSNFAGFFVRAQAKSLKESFVRSKQLEPNLPPAFVIRSPKQVPNNWHMKHEVSKTCLLEGKVPVPKNNLNKQTLETFK